MADQDVTTIGVDRVKLNHCWKECIVRYHGGRPLNYTKAVEIYAEHVASNGLDVPGWGQGGMRARQKQLSRLLLRGSTQNIKRWVLQEWLEVMQFLGKFDPPLQLEDFELPAGIGTSLGVEQDDYALADEEKQLGPAPVDVSPVGEDEVSMLSTPEVVGLFDQELETTEEIVSKALWPWPNFAKSNVHAEVVALEVTSGDVHRWSPCLSFASTFDYSTGSGDDSQNASLINLSVQTPNLPAKRWLRIGQPWSGIAITLVLSTSTAYWVGVRDGTPERGVDTASPATYMANRPPIITAEVPDALPKAEPITAVQGLSVGGRWIQTQQEGGLLITSAAEGDELLLFGDPTWKDYEVSCTVRMGTTGARGIALLGKDTGKFLLFSDGWVSRSANGEKESSRTECLLAEMDMRALRPAVRGGVEVGTTRSRLLTDANGGQTLTTRERVYGATERFVVRVENGRCTCSIDDEVIFENIDVPADLIGRTGLFFKRPSAGECYFYDIQVEVLSGVDQGKFFTPVLGPEYH